MSDTPKECNEEKFLEFHEFHMESTFCDFSDSGAPLQNGLSSLHLDQGFEEFDLDSKYRSIGYAPNSNPLGFNLATHSAPPVGKDSAPLGHSSAGTTVFTRQDVPKSSLAAPKIEVTGKHSNSASKSSRPISAPMEPFYVAPSTHFVSMLNVGDIKARVEVGLNSQTSVSYEFFGAKCRWEGVYLVGSARCKFEINVYKRASGGFVVEGNRLSGDGFAFVNMYKAIRNIFVPSTDTSAEPLLLSPPSRRADPLEVQKSINAVLSMANSGIGEAQVSASQILCNLSSDHSKHAMLVSSGCIAALVKLMTIEFQSCNQHAICGLANLSSSHSCQEVLMRDQSFLHTLLPLCSDGNYNTIEMRREGARLLANICCCGGEAGAQQVVSSAGLENIASWLQSVDGLKDERLRVYADQAKESLASCT